MNYRNSPALAVWIAERKWARVLTRFALTLLVYSIKYPLLPVMLLTLWVLSRRQRRIKRAAIA